jgi:hypothetical protein
MSNIIDQIHKLRNLMSSSNKFEADAAAKAADRLIAKHRISEAELDASNPNKKLNPLKDSNILYESGRITAWKSTLAVILARHYGCAIINDAITNPANNRKLNQYRMVGIESDMEIVRYMFGWLVNLIDEMGKIVARGNGRIYAASYAEGVVNGIRLTLSEAKKEQVAEAAATGQSSALVKLDERFTSAQETLRSLYPRTSKSIRSKRRVNDDARNRGIQDGKKIQLNKGLTN